MSGFLWLPRCTTSQRARSSWTCLSWKVRIQAYPTHHGSSFSLIASHFFHPSVLCCASFLSWQPFWATFEEMAKKGSGLRRAITAIRLGTAILDRRTQNPDEPWEELLIDFLNDEFLPPALKIAAKTACKAWASGPQAQRERRAMQEVLQRMPCPATLSEAQESPCFTESDNFLQPVLHTGDVEHEFRSVPIDVRLEVGGGQEWMEGAQGRGSP